MFHDVKEVCPVTNGSNLFAFQKTKDFKKFDTSLPTPFKLLQQLSE
jgi:hypothetical protein